MPQALEATLLTAAEEAMQMAKEIVPVQTGRLRDSIRVLERGPNFIVVGSDIEYAAAVEFGTYKMAARPYMGPAGDAIVSRFQEIFAQELNSRLP